MLRDWQKLNTKGFVEKFSDVSRAMCIEQHLEYKSESQQANYFKSGLIKSA